ncbi:MAG: hypothetical protein H6737_16375 [Alphaproteobacteria bacterium]|nr:hypothetical protein [Alphaproteobacteria bacterium]
MALCACRPSDPLDPLLDALRPAHLEPSQREGLPDRFVALAIRADRATLVGVDVAIESRDLAVDAELGAVLWPPLFGAAAADLADRPPLVLAVERGVPPSLVREALGAARAEGFDIQLGLGFGTGTPPDGSVAAGTGLAALYDLPDDPQLYPSFASARAHAAGRVLWGPDLLGAHADAVLDDLRADLVVRPERAALVHALLDAVAARAPDSPAVPWLATAATLAGTPLDALHVEGPVAEAASTGAARHRQQSRRTGWWASHRELEDAFLLERWLEQPLPDEVQTALRQALVEEPGLLARLRAERDLHAVWNGRPTLPDPTGTAPTALLGAGRPGGADAQGAFPARLAWAREAVPSTPPRLVRAVPVDDTVPPATLGLLPAPEHYARMEAALVWLADALPEDADRDAVLALHALYGDAAAGRAEAVLARIPDAPRSDVRQAVPTAWSARDRPTTRLVLGVVHVPVDSATLLAVHQVSAELERPILTVALREAIDAGPRPSRVLGSLTGEPHRSGGCQIAP